MASSDDEDLKRAIAMSLQEHSSNGKASPSPANVVDLISDDDEEDEDLRRAIALSMQEHSERAGDSVGLEAKRTVSHLQEYASVKAEHNYTARPPVATQTTSTPISGLLGLDRKAMEQERLARLGKRKRSASPDRPSKQIVKAPQPPTESLAPLDEYQTPSKDGSKLQYPKGTIKRTFAFKHPRTDDIKIEEVLQAATVNIAILSSFQFDDRWLFSKLDPKKTKQVWVMNAKGQDVQDKLFAEMEECKIPNLKLHFPPMPGDVHSMHSKFMLLFHDKKLRVVIPTANMFLVDWGETNRNSQGVSWQAAVMENSVFLIDLPRRVEGQVGSKEELTFFGKELVHFLEKQQLGQNVIDGVLKFDFSNTNHIAFVHSIGGSHTGQARERTGLPGLSNAVRTLNLHEVEDIQLDCTASSLGALKISFLERIFLAARGELGLSDAKIPSHFLEKIQIYFPTKETVLESTGGPDCGGIITLRSSDYNSKVFPKQCMRDYTSTRKGVLSHNKLLLARGRKKDGRPFAWVYIGSANISEAAWGFHSGKKQQPNLRVRNWECGVLVPVPEEKFKGLELEAGEMPPMSVFEGTVEVPFKYPGEHYGEREPWYFQAHA